MNSVADFLSRASVDAVKGQEVDLKTQVYSYFRAPPTVERVLSIADMVQEEEDHDLEEDLEVVRRYLTSMDGHGVPFRLRRQARRFCVADGVLIRCIPEDLRVVPGRGSREKIMFAQHDCF